MVVDALDAGYGECVGAGEGLTNEALAIQSTSVAELLLRHLQFFPPWILLICSARRQNKAVCKMFSGTLGIYTVFRTMCVH